MLLEGMNHFNNEFCFLFTSLYQHLFLIFYYIYTSICFLLFSNISFSIIGFLLGFTDSDLEKPRIEIAPVAEKCDFCLSKDGGPPHVKVCSRI